MIVTSRFVFVHVPKTAGRSMQAVLGAPATMPLSDHATAQEIRAYLGVRQFAERISFGFVRDPWQREVSLYFHTLRNPAYEHHAAVRARTSFRDYVAWMVEHGARRPQCDYLTDEQGRVLVNIVGRFERLTADFEAISKSIGQPVRILPSIGRGDYGDWRQYHDSFTIAALANYYKADIEWFGYRRPR